ncbi:hypothetical protein SDC9_122514 [bioreactor metagenome]|jgi:VanZ family protein|uniref:VanZ-like domain-containing protein n=1 Tax=bioreactor metagenome TaxID=1076179 RepID=A0A645CF16_9ZZZZ
MSVKKTNPILKAASYYLPVLLWAALIFFFSNQESLPSFETSFLDFLFKKSAHMFVYAVLYLLLFRAFAQESAWQLSRKNFLLPFFLCFLYSVTDEIHQHFTPGRHPSPRDVGFDLLGVSSVLLFQQGFFIPNKGISA